jgi:hypothetical protein
MARTLFAKQKSTGRQGKFERFWGLVGRPPTEERPAMAEWFSRAQVHEQLRELGYGEVSDETFEEFYAGKSNATRVKLSFPIIIHCAQK